jgi:hypothetical protein
MTGDGEGRRDGSWTSAIDCQCLGAKPPWASATERRLHPGSDIPKQRGAYPSFFLISSAEQSTCSRMSGPGEERYASISVLFDLNKPDFLTDSCVVRLDGAEVVHTIKTASRDKDTLTQGT